MPISLDSSTEEITKALISTYENKLHNMCTIEDGILSECIKLNNKNCRYIHIETIPVDDMSGSVLGHDVAFDVKYNVPIIEAKSTTQYDSILRYKKGWSFLAVEGRYKEFKFVDGNGNTYYTSCYFLKENELFNIVTLNEYYNPDMVKTYKRYIELRGE